MTHSILIVLGLFLVLLNGCAIPEVRIQPTEATEIRSCYDKIVAISNEGDIEALLAISHPDLRLFIEPNGPSGNRISSGKTQLLRDYMADIAKLGKIADFQVHSISILGDSAIARVIIRRAPKNFYEIWYFKKFNDAFLLRQSPFIFTSVSVEQLLHSLPESVIADCEFIRSLETK